MTTRIIKLRNAVFALLLPWLAPLAAAQDVQVSAEEPLRVQEVTCAGNLATSCDFIRDYLYLKAGQPLDEEEIRNAELRLSFLRNFEWVRFRLEKGAQRGAVIVVIEVKEANPLGTDWLLGASSRRDSLSGVFAGRIAHRNLFGEGKYADLTAVSVVPVDGEAFREFYDVSLRYSDPQLFGSSRYYASASASWHRRRYEDAAGNFGNLDTTQLDLSVGRRFADFSYFTFVLSFRHDPDWLSGRWDEDGSFIVSRPDWYSPRTFSLIYGWNTEDDLNFPTQGSTLQIIAGGDYQSDSPLGRSHLQFRKTWPMLGGYGTVKLGGDPSPEYRISFSESQLLSFAYAHPVSPGDTVQRGRWYIEPGIGFAGYGDRGVQIYEYGIKAGFRADTRTFGLVDLYVLGRVDTFR